MAITYKGAENTSGEFEITNGHFEQLKEIAKQYDIDGEAKTLAFLIALGNEAKGKPIVINGKNIEPSEDIKKKAV